MTILRGHAAISFASNMTLTLSETTIYGTLNLKAIIFYGDLGLSIVGETSYLRWTLNSPPAWWCIFSQHRHRDPQGEYNRNLTDFERLLKQYWWYTKWFWLNSFIVFVIAWQYWYLWGIQTWQFQIPYQIVVSMGKPSINQGCSSATSDSSLVGFRSKYTLADLILPQFTVQVRSIDAVGKSPRWIAGNKLKDPHMSKTHGFGWRFSPEKPSLFPTWNSVLQSALRRFHCDHRLWSSASLVQRWRQGVVVREQGRMVVSGLSCSPNPPIQINPVP